MKGGGCIRQAEWHDIEFICAVTGDEGGFIAVGGVNGDLVVATKEVEFCEYSCVCKAIVKVVNAGDRESVFDCNIVETAIVDTHSHGSVFLFD